MFEIVLDSYGKALCHLLFIPDQEAELAVVDKGILTASVIFRVVISKLDSANAPEDTSPDAGPIHRQARERGLPGQGVHAGRALPEPSVRVDSEFVAFHIRIKAHGDFVILQPVFGSVGLYYCISTCQTSQGAVVIGDTSAVDKAVGIEPGRINNIEVGQVTEDRDLHGVGWCFQILFVAPDKEGFPVLRKQVVDEDQVTGPPG